jgi:hypothetical protein
MANQGHLVHCPVSVYCQELEVLVVTLFLCARVPTDVWELCNNAFTKRPMSTALAISGDSFECSYTGVCLFEFVMTENPVVRSQVPPPPLRRMSATWLAACFEEKTFVISSCSFPEGWSWPLTSIWRQGQRASGAVPPLPQYAFMAWCSVKAQGQLWYQESKSASFYSWFWHSVGFVGLGTVDVIDDF